MKKYLSFSKRQPSLDRFAVSRGGWSGSERFNGKSFRRTSAASLNTRSIQVVRGAYNIDLNKVDSSFTKLHRACLLNDDAQVRKHIQKVDNNLHDSSHRYPIHLTTVNGNLAILKLLIENGADPNVQDNEGNTPLIKSIECGHEHLVKYFLANGADPNQSDMDNNTALHWAITTESIIAIEALLNSQRCDLTLRNNKDETCLHLAVRSPLINTSTFESMVKNGADLQAKDQLGLTVLDIAHACNNKVALNAFSRYCRLEKNPACNNHSTPLTNVTNDDSAQQQLNANGNTDCEKAGIQRPVQQQAANSDSGKSMNEDYRSRYQSKNRENLEYEKRLIQLNAQIERLKLDLSYLKEQNESLKLNRHELVQENSRLKLENSKLVEQLKSNKKRQDSIGRTPSSSSSERPPSQREEFHDTSSTPPVALAHGHPDETIECRSHKEFLVARRMNQERINKLKNSLTT